MNVACRVRVASSGAEGWISSDRTIQEYCREIRDVKPIHIK